MSKRERHPRAGGRLAPTILLALVTLSGFAALPRAASAATFTVTNTNDSGPGSWEQQLLTNEQALAARWVARPEFAALVALTDAQYVDKLFENAGAQPTQALRDALVAGLQNQSETRASVLLKVAEDEKVGQKLFNEGFVLMQYFGYLRRNPDDAPDSDMSGHNYWLAKLDAFGGDFVKAEMVKAFLVSTEYRQRFGQN